MKPQHEAKTKAGGSHGAGGVAGVLKAPPAIQGGKGAETLTPKPVIAPPAVSEASMQHELLLAYEGETEKILRSETGGALFALIRLADGTLNAVASPELKERMMRLARGDKNDGVHELAGALRRLKQLPTETPDIIYRNKLDSSMRVNLACMVRELQSFINRDESTLADVFQKALDALRSTSITPKNVKADSIKVKIPWGLFGEKVDMPLALPAIIHARRFVEKQERLPTKKELAAMLRQEYGLQISKGYWRKVWTGAGLNDLPKNAPTIEKQKGQLDRVRTKFTKTVQKA